MPCDGMPDTVIKVTKTRASRYKSPGPVVMRGGSRSRGYGFESQHQILDGHFSHYKIIVTTLFVRLKIN